MSWIWIALIAIVGSAMINPILYFIKWELYDRADWISNTECYEHDKRFWTTESFWQEDTDGLKRQYTKQVQIAEVRPQVKDAWNAFDERWVWFTPIVSSITTVVYTSMIVVRPFDRGWRWVVKKIANIKI